MSDRDDLADLIEGAWYQMPKHADPLWDYLADTILANGWRPPLTPRDADERHTIQEEQL